MPIKPGENAIILVKQKYIERCGLHKWSGMKFLGYEEGNNVAVILAKYESIDEIGNIWITCNWEDVDYSLMIPQKYVLLLSSQMSEDIEKIKNAIGFKTHT